MTTPAPVPNAGDAVRLMAPSPGMPELAVGKVGILDGILGHPSDTGGASIIWNPRTYRDDTHVSVSGGPGTIWTPYAELRPTGEIVTVRVWRFKDDRRAAGNGVESTVDVPLWDWYPGEAPAGTLARIGEPHRATASAHWCDVGSHNIDLDAPVWTVRDLAGNRQWTGGAGLACERHAPPEDAASDPVWTVAGVWIGDDPIPVGVIPGRHDVTGCGAAVAEHISEAGPWATSVTAPDAETAEARAAEAMKAGEG